MRHVALLVCKEALFGFSSPISFLTEANLQKAIDFLRNGGCDFLYISVDNFEEKSKVFAEKYLNDYMASLGSKLQAKIFISASSKHYVEMFIEYIKQIPGEICVDIFARLDEKCQIELALNRALDMQHIIHEGNIPLVFVASNCPAC